MLPRSQLPRLSDRVPSQSLLEDMNTAIQTIPTRTITEMNQMIYTMPTVILEMRGYRMNMRGYRMNSISHKEYYPSWKRRLKTKIEATWREVSQLSELQKGGEERCGEDGPARTTHCPHLRHWRLPSKGSQLWLPDWRDTQEKQKPEE